MWAYAHKRGMQIIAEGLKSAEEVETYLRLGVDLLQGYFLARPAQIPAPISKEAYCLIQSRQSQFCAANSEPACAT